MIIPNEGLTQSIEVIMIDFHANYLSTLYSFNQGSLYHRNGKASPSFLVKPMAQAIVYLNTEVDSVLADMDKGKPLPARDCSVILRDLLAIDRQARKLGLTLQLAKEVDTLIKTGFLQRRK